MKFRNLCSSPFSYALALSLACLGCGSSESDINSYIYGIETLPVEDSQIVRGEPGQPAADGDFVCSTENVSETRQYDRIVAYAANSESLWPGALVRGDSVYEGLFTQIPLERQPLTFSVGLESLDGRKSSEVESPSLSSYREALADVLDSTLSGATTANIYAEIEQVHSERQLSIALGAQAKWALASVAGSFDFSRETVRSRYLVRYTQAYYTVDVDPPATPEDFFADSVKLSDIEERTWPGNPALYVSSITYGRTIVFTFESNYSADEMNAALEFAYRGGVDVSGDVSVSYKQMLNSSNITAYVLGGSGERAAQSIDNFDALMEFLREGGNYSKDSPGAPIAYKLAYVASNQPARLSFTEDYQVKECHRVTQKVKVSLVGIHVDDAGESDNALELFGKIVAAGKNEVTLFDREESEFVRVDQGETWPTQGVIAEAVLDVTPESGHSISLAADLTDSDSRFWFFSNDHSVGDEEMVIPFETGWRKDVTVHLTGDNARVELMFSLTPI